MGKAKINVDATVENQKFIPESCYFCGETPIIYIYKDGEKNIGQVECPCGARGSKREFSIGLNKDICMTLLKQEWDSVHGYKTFLDQLKESLTYG